MELGIIIVLALAGIYTTMLAVGTLMEGKETRREHEAAVEATEAQQIA